MNREATSKIFDLRLDFDYKVSVTLKELASLEDIRIRIGKEDGPLCQLWLAEERLSQNLRVE